MILIFTGPDREAVLELADETAKMAGTSPAYAVVSAMFRGEEDDPYVSAAGVLSKTVSEDSVCVLMPEEIPVLKDQTRMDTLVVCLSSNPEDIIYRKVSQLRFHGSVTTEDVEKICAEALATDRAFKDAPWTICIPYPAMAELHTILINSIGREHWFRDMCRRCERRRERERL